MHFPCDEAPAPAKQISQSAVTQCDEAYENHFLQSTTAFCVPMLSRLCLFNFQNISKPVSAACHMHLLSPFYTLFCFSSIPLLFPFSYGKIEGRGKVYSKAENIQDVLTYPLLPTTKIYPLSTCATKTIQMF